MTDSVENTEVVSLEDYEAVNKKLEVAKDFLKELDAKMTKYESMDLDQTITDIEKYESLGTPEELVKLVELVSADVELRSSKLESDESILSKYESLGTPEELTKLLSLVEKDLNSRNEKSESPEGEEVEASCPECNSTDVELSEDETSLECNECDYEGSLTKSSPEGEDKSKSEGKIMNEEYLALGTIEEIKAVFESYTKVQDKLESYAAIGTQEEIIDLCEDYDSMRTKVEAERISSALGVSVERVTSTISKLESISEAEGLLFELFSKAEAEVEVKTESAVDVVDEVEILNEAPVVKSESTDLSKIKELCRKL